MSRLPKPFSRYGQGRSPVLRILLVDDDPALRTLLRTTFEVADVGVVEAENAYAARRQIERARPSVIVLDVNMPGKSGLELCRELKDDPSTRDIPIVLLTGSEGGTTAAAKQVGADAFVRKPFSPLELLAVAERLAGGLYGVPFRATKKHAKRPEAELLLYARDLRHMLELERRALATSAELCNGARRTRGQHGRVEGSELGVRLSAA
ncbi:MAG: response regulator [Actinobacteria bacterium]|nr:MAG: response regulator [Actinomycetota bacterium]